MNSNYLISITPRIVGAASADLETNGLLLTENVLLNPQLSLLQLNQVRIISELNLKRWISQISIFPEQIISKNLLVVCLLLAEFQQITLLGFVRLQLLQH